MRRINYLTVAIIALLMLSFIAMGINICIYEYPGNNYYPADTPLIALQLFLIYCGFFLTLGHSNKFTQMSRETIYFFLVMALLAFATNAIQYTPFSPIDKQLLTVEVFCHINMQEILAWTHANPTFKKCLEFTYNSLPYQMAYIPLIFIVSRRFQLLREYYFLLITSTLLGFTFYYFFPTTAPASMIDSDYFNVAQKATGLKFSQIHQHIPPTTLDGGLIAMPSFHAIWSWFCLYILRVWPALFLTLLPINILLIASCILLGWHYSMDILGGALIIIITHGLYYKRDSLNTYRFSHTSTAQYLP